MIPQNHRNLRKHILLVTEGVLSSLTDFLLAVAYLGLGSVGDYRLGRDFNYSLRKLDERMEKVSHPSVKRAFVHARHQGLLKREFQLTKKGRERLNSILPLSYPVPPSWQGKWYLVAFDIPEKNRAGRDLLRIELKRLGFGRLQGSVWLSPYNRFREIGRFVKRCHLEPFVIFSTATRIGKTTSKQLAEKIWQLSRVQSAYGGFIKKFHHGHKAPFFEITRELSYILERDPKLPYELLPEGWSAKEAFAVYENRLREYSI